LADAANPIQSYDFFKSSEGTEKGLGPRDRKGRGGWKNGRTLVSVALVVPLVYRRTLVGMRVKSQSKLDADFVPTDDRFPGTQNRMRR
jgi:hypothetical protein